MFTLFTSAMLFLVFCIQEFIPRMGENASHALIMLFPLWFLCTAVTVSYPVMLVQAFVCGLLWDLRYTIDPGYGIISDIPFGITVLLYGLLGCVMQGSRGHYAKGQFMAPVFMAGICLILSQLLEYLFLNFKRGSFSFPRPVLVEMAASALVSVAIAPLIIALLYWLSKSTGYHPRRQAYPR